MRLGGGAITATSAFPLGECCSISSTLYYMQTRNTGLVLARRTAQPHNWAIAEPGNWEALRWRAKVKPGRGKAGPAARFT